MSDGQRAHRTAQIDRNTQPFEDAASRHFHLPVVDETRTRPQVLFESDVLCDCHLGKEREILPDHLDAQFPCLRRIQPLDRLTVHQHDGIRLRLIDTADDLDQRALAAAVLAGKAQHLAGHDVEPDGLERFYTAEYLGDIVELEQGGAGGVDGNTRFARVAPLRRGAIL